MFVIAAPCSPPICVVWYSNGPGLAWNCHPNNEPQNCWLLVVSSAGSRCARSRLASLPPRLSFAAMPPLVLRPSGSVRLIGSCPGAGPRGYFRTRDRRSRTRVTPGRACSACPDRALSVTSLDCPKEYAHTAVAACLGVAWKAGLASDRDRCAGAEPVHRIGPAGRLGEGWCRGHLALR